jgi:hypothetical protein
MQCASCGKITRELKSDLCFRCFVIGRAILLEPNMPYSQGIVEIKPSGSQPKQSGFMFRAFVSDLQIKNDQ